MMVFLYLISQIHHNVLYSWTISPITVQTYCPNLIHNTIHIHESSTIRFTSSTFRLQFIASIISSIICPLLISTAIKLHSCFFAILLSLSAGNGNNVFSRKSPVLIPLLAKSTADRAILLLIP